MMNGDRPDLMSTFIVMLKKSDDMTRVLDYYVCSASGSVDDNIVDSRHPSSAYDGGVKARQLVDHKNISVFT